jgi:uncharacterized protein YndB with AHSA1/START domain
MPIHFEHSVEVARGPEHAFAVLDDFAQTPKWLDRCTHIDILTNGPHAVGTKLRYGYREAGRTGTMDGEISAHAPNERLAMRYSDSMLEVAVEFRLAPTDTGTRLTQIVEITPKTLVVKLISPLIRRQLPGQTTIAMERLKRLVESSSPAA